MKIAVGMPKVAATMIGVRLFGNRWRMMMCAPARASDSRGLHVFLFS